MAGGAGRVGQNLAVLLDSRSDLEQVYIDEDPGAGRLLTDRRYSDIALAESA